MKESDLKYLSHLHYVIEEIEKNIEDVKNMKKDFIKEQEKRFSRRSKDGLARFTAYIEKNPNSDAAKRINELEKRLRHLLKELDKQKSHVERIESR